MGYPYEACAAVIEGLEAIGIEFFLHGPDSFGTPVIAHFENFRETRIGRWVYGRNRRPAVWPATSNQKICF